MTHTWKTQGHLVLHSSTAGHSCDSVGVGLGEDRLGPFSSLKLAQTVADALANAYLAGQNEVSDAWAQADAERTEQP
jgi:hypothetical protein